MQSLLIAAEEGGGFDPLSPEFGLPLWITLAFIVVFYFLAKKAFPKLDETLADRERRIKLDLEQAEETRREADKILEEYKSRISQAREESNRIIEETRASAESLRKDLIARAEAESREIVTKAQAQLESERDRAVGELQRQLAQWSADIAGRIIQKELNPDTHRDLVESFIRDVDGNGRRSGEFQA